MKHRPWPNSRNVGWLVIGVLAVVAAASWGCSCTKGVDHVIVAMDVNGERYVENPQGNGSWVLIDPPGSSYPDGNVRLIVKPGQKICFFNATPRDCKVESNKGAYTKSNIFTIAPDDCVTRTIASLPENTEIDPVITCGDDHGAPSMIVKTSDSDNE